MANKISVILDVATEKAVSGLKGFKQSVADADGALNKTKAGAASVFDSIKANAGLAGIAVAGAIGAMAAKSIEAASRLGESVNAVNVTFGRSAEGIKQLGEQAAESVGLSNAEFNGLAVQFSAFAETIAGRGGDVVGTIDDMTTRAADFASVMNIDVAEAARLFQSGLAGETEPLKKFGIDLSAAAVETYALANGIGTAGEAMTEAQKVQARYGLLMESTEKTAGDFANTTDGLANSQRILAAKTEDTAAKVGQKLAPAMAQVTGMLSDIIPVAGDVAIGVGKAFEKMVDAAYDFGQGIADVVDALPFVDMPGPIAETLYEQEKLARQTEELVAEYSKGTPTMAKFIEALEAQGLSQHAINLAIIEYRKVLDEATAAAMVHVPVLEDYIEMQQEGTAATDESTEATEEASKASSDFKGALQDLTDAMDDRIEATNALVGGDIAVRDSQREAATAVAELTVATDEGKLSIEELAVMTDDAALSLIDAATAAADYDEKIAAAAGKTLTASEKQDLLRSKLGEVASTLAPGSPLRVMLEEYIALLEGIPPVIETNVRVTRTGDLLTPINGMRASGGPVSAGGTYVVGEQGPELLTMGNSSGNIIPNGAIVGGAAGGVTVNVAVQTLDGTISAPALAKLVEAINRGVRTGAVKLA